MDSYYFLFKVLGSKTDWHFVQPALSHARTKRSFSHYKKLNDDRDVSFLKKSLKKKKLLKISELFLFLICDSTKKKKKNIINLIQKKLVKD